MDGKKQSLSGLSNIDLTVSEKCLCHQVLGCHPNLGHNEILLSDFIVTPFEAIQRIVFQSIELQGKRGPPGCPHMNIHQYIKCLDCQYCFVISMKKSSPGGSGEDT